MNKIKRLMESDHVSGEELGRLIIYNDICTYKKQLGKQEYGDESIDQETMDELISRIDTIEDANILECFVQLQRFIQYSQAMSFAYNQQAQNGFSRMFMYMTQAQQVEHARKTLEMLPIIMTETQFSEMHSPGRIARMRGVAIVAESFPCRPKCLDANDCFIEPEIDCFQEMMSLEHISTIKDKIFYFRDELMLKGLRYQTAYNTLFELIAERLEMPEFKVFCTDTSEIIKQIDEYNLQVMHFKYELAGEGKEYLNKKEILKEVFTKINTDNIKPSESVISVIREKLKDINTLCTPMNVLVNMLMENRSE